MSDFWAGKSRRNCKPAKIRYFLLLLTLSVLPPAQAEWFQQQRDIMGTRISLELWQQDNTSAEHCSEQVFEEMHRIDALMSSYKSTSELSFINNNAAISSVKISEELAYLLERSLFFSKISDGAFDITYASIGYAYDYRRHLKPSDEEVALKLPAINYRNIMLDKNKIRFSISGVRIDLGGIAKGYAVDRAIDILRDCGVEQAMVSAGGDSRIIGDKQGRPWIIGIQHPREDEQLALRLPLSDSAISTSGDYQRYYIEQGKRIHHIINPVTGRSSEGSWSATVTGSDAMTTDALSTTIFVLGAVAGLALIESLPGIDAIIIDSNGKMHYSSGFQTPEAAQ